MTDMISSLLPGGGGGSEDLWGMTWFSGETGRGSVTANRVWMGIDGGYRKLTAN